MTRIESMSSAVSLADSELSRVINAGNAVENKSIAVLGINVALLVGLIGLRSSLNTTKYADLIWVGVVLVIIASVYTIFTLRLSKWALGADILKVAEALRNPELDDIEFFQYLLEDFSYLIQLNTSKQGKRSKNYILALWLTGIASSVSIVIVADVIR